MSFGENVRWLRTTRGMTQAQLAALTRVNHHHPTASYISRVEHSEIDPRLKTVISIARALKVRPWQLVADISENTTFWDGYMSLSGASKREVQRLIEWQLRRSK